MTRVYFSCYRWAWILALPFIRILSGIDGALRSALGRGFLPAPWRVRERLGSQWRARDTGPRSAHPNALWMHCASLGEAKGLWAFANALDGVAGLILTATTAEGFAYLAERCMASSGDASFSDGRRIRAAIAPLDHPGLIRRFLAAHGVIGLCLYEVELWPNTLAVCKESGLPVVLVSGRLTAKAARVYRRFGGAGATLLDGLAWIQAQSPLDAERFAAITRTEILAGFDFKAAHYLGFAVMDAMDADPAAEAKGPVRNRFAFVSLHLEELDLLLPGLLELMRRTDLVVIPRKLSELSDFRNRLEPEGFVLHSRDPSARYLLVDTLGKIGSLLPECHSAFIGGSLIPIGCHNLWEPLMAGAKIHFGPHLHHQEYLAGRVIEAGVAEVLEDPGRIASLDAPGPGIPAACRGLVDALRQGLDSALAEGGRRIFATFFSVQTLGGTGKRTRAAGIEKGQER
jgi:3-deoxy-D-manno-octulosonic-acid transferase